MFRIYWWNGGTDRGDWRMVLREFASEEQAQGIVSDIERMGYVTVVGHVNVGAPEGPPSRDRFRQVGFL